jgi:replicative DNA helicase
MAQRALHAVPSRPRDPRGLLAPHNLDVEAVVLSAVLTTSDGLDRVADILKPEHFFADANGRIFEACVALALEAEPVDVATVAAHLRDRERLAEVGGSSYLAQLAFQTPAVAHLENHARIVFNLWRRRQLIATCQRVAAEGYGDVGELQDWFDGAEQAVTELARPPEDAHTVTVAESFGDVFEEMKKAAERGEAFTGLETGFEELDAMLCGLHPAEVTVLAGRPGMGKTALATAIALNVADRLDPDKQRRNGVIVFSLEMDHQQFTTRAACTEARVPLSAVRKACLDPDGWRRMTAAGEWLCRLPLLIDSTSPINPFELRAKVRRVRAQWERRGIRLALVVVDYLQRMTAASLLPSSANREQEVAYCSRALADLSKEMRVPVLELAQLNRAVERQKDKRPGLADLRESGQIEQDASTIVFVHREEQYLRENCPPDDRGVAELIVAKQRYGETGTAYTRFVGRWTMFADKPTDAEGRGVMW